MPLSRWTSPTKSSKGRDVDLQDIPLLNITTVDSNISSTTSDTQHFPPLNPFSTPEDNSYRAASASEPHRRPNSSHGDSLLSSLSVPSWRGLRSSLEVTSPDTEHSNRNSQLRGVDASARPERQMDITSTNIFVQKDGVASEDPTSFKLGLEEALGRDGNWLTKKSDPTASDLPEINRDQLDLDFARPVSQNLDEPIRPPDQFREAEQGLIIQRSRSSVRASRASVQTFSRAVKNISTRVLGQSQDDSQHLSPNTSQPQPSSIQIYDTSYQSPFTEVSLKSPNVSTHSRSAHTPSVYSEYLAPGGSQRSTRRPSVHFEDSTESLADTERFSSTLIGSADPLVPLPPLQLIGKSLKMFGPKNKFRLFLYNQLNKVWVEPFTFFVIISQTLVLTFGNIRNIYDGADGSDDYGGVFQDWGTSWVNWCQLIIFIYYSLVACAKAIAYGLWDDSQRKKALEQEKKDVSQHSGRPFSSSGMRDKISQISNPFSSSSAQEGSRRRNVVKDIPLVPTFAQLIPGQRKDGHLPRSHTVIGPDVRVATDRAYLRSSWNRLQFIAIISYWVSLLLTINNADLKSEVFVFRLLSGLPILHLLNLTAGTSSVLKSLKSAAPLLVNVGLFVGFFW